MRVFWFLRGAYRPGPWAVPLLAVGLFSSGCSGEDARSGDLAVADEQDASSGALVVDDNRDTLSTAIPRERVVSLAPAITETIVAMGGVDRLVARTRFDDDPRLSSLPSVGGMVDPSVETILTLGPDLIVISDEAEVRSLTSVFRGFGISTYVAESRSISDFRRHSRALGALLAMTMEADSLVGWVDRELESVRPRVPFDPLPSVLFVVWPEPLVTTGRGTFVDELIRISGGRGTFDDVAASWPTVSFEPVVSRDPAVILMATGRGSDPEPLPVLASSRWTALSAVRNGDLHQVDADLYTRAGPGMVEAARSLARFIRRSRAGP